MNGDNSNFNIKIVTPSGVALNKNAIFMSVPVSNGEIGILPNHSATLVKSMKGSIKVRYSEDKENIFDCSEGFVHVLPKKVTVIVDECKHLDKA